MAAWAAAITILSSLSGQQLHDIAPFDLWDKAAHFLAFAVGAMTLTVALAWSTAWPGRRIALFAVLAVALFGAIDEYHQTFTPHRSGADVPDWIADTLGALTGTLGVLFIHARSTRPPYLAPAGN